MLNRGFEEHLAAEYLASWREFVTRVWADDAAIARLRADGTEDVPKRHVMLQAIALRSHPDGVESLLMAVRDTSPLRRIEESLQDEQRFNSI